MSTDSPITPDAWQELRAATTARVALGRAGGSLPTTEWLAFKSDHAAARDAIHEAFDAQRLAAEVAALGVETVVVDSAAVNRAVYLQRPDLGRQLSPESAERLRNRGAASMPYDVSITVSDGLSATAAHRQACPVLEALLPRLRADHWRVAPVAIARFGRVALQDQIGDLFAAQLALILIGERPGLSSPDSLGAYLVYNPRQGNTDAQRNCVSNIRTDGLPPAVAAETLHFLLTASRARKLSGVELKDERTLPAVPTMNRLE